MVVERQLTSYVEKLYPYNGRIFREGSRYQFDKVIEPEAPLSRQNDPHWIKQRMLQKKVDLLVEKIREEEDNRIKVSAIIWNQLTPEFQRKVEKALDFDDVRGKRDDHRLMKIVRELCLGTAESHQNLVVKKMKATRPHQLLRQKDTESVLDFKERVMAALIKMSALDIELPTDAEQAINFVDALDSKRYGDCQIEISNAQLTGVNIYPRPLIDAATQAANRRVLIKGQPELTVDHS
jgi:hypothetical protein